jgi:hypothetical protein
VINLSLGGVRDPLHPTLDTYSSLEASAVAYAYAKGALVVAAVGNGDEAVSEPWPYASYPAALPHVLGVSALTQAGNVPAYSNRDAIFNDISAPGSGIFSTFPLSLTAAHPVCADQGYSDCGPDDYTNPDGTSFSAPQVTAAAAVLFALAPALTASQVSTILEHTADDVNAGTGCSKCRLGRDNYSGWGHLDVAKAVAALAAPLPPLDQDEPNDNAGRDAYTLWGKQPSLTATLDYYDDPVDVYRIELRAGERVAIRANGGWAAAQLNLALWKPGTRQITTMQAKKLRAAQSALPGAMQRVTFTAQTKGWYYVELKAAAAGFGSYTLSIVKS